jgi:hypothetical protein
MPWSVLNHRQRTPVWDAILLLLSGVVVIFGENSEVVSLTDEKGHDLNASSAKDQNALRGKLLRIPGLFGIDPIRGGFYVGRLERQPLIFNPNVIKAIGQLQSSVLGNETVLPSGVLRNNLSVAPPVRLPVVSDAPINAIAGAVLMDMVRAQGISYLSPKQPTALDTIRCKLKGKSKGKLDSYHKRGLLGVQIQGDVAINEAVEIDYEQMSGRNNAINIQSQFQREYMVTITQKLGAGKDFLKVAIAGLPSEPSKPTSINVQPGIGVMDVLTADIPKNVQVSVNGIVGGNRVKSSFNTQLQGGQRFILPELSNPDRLKVENIDTLLGKGRGSQFINRQ